MRLYLFVIFLFFFCSRFAFSATANIGTPTAFGVTFTLGGETGNIGASADFDINTGAISNKFQQKVTSVVVNTNDWISSDIQDMISHVPFQVAVPCDYFTIKAIFNGYWPQLVQNRIAAGNAPTGFIGDICSWADSVDTDGNGQTDKQDILAGNNPFGVPPPDATNSDIVNELEKMNTPGSFSPADWTCNANEPDWAALFTKWKLKINKFLPDVNLSVTESKPPEFVMNIPIPGGSGAGNDFYLTGDMSGEGSTISGLGTAVSKLRTIVRALMMIAIFYATYRHLITVLRQY